QRRSRGDRCTPPFFRPLDALAVDDRGDWACFSSGLLSTFHVKSMVDTIQRAVVVPKREVAIHRAARGQILRDRAPLAARAQHVHQAVDHVADAHRSLATPALRRWNDRCDESPFLICQVAGIAKLAAVVATAVLVRPHRRYPANRADAIESQVIPTIQDVFGRTLSTGSSEPITGATGAMTGVDGRPTSLLLATRVGSSTSRCVASRAPGR